MTRRSARFRVVWAAVAAGLLLGATACSDSSDDEPTEQSGDAASTGTDTPAVATVTTVDGVSGRLHEDKRPGVKEAVSQLIDQWLEGAYLGEFPRSDYTAAFAGFTPGAQKTAMRDLDLMSNQAISDRIESADAVNRRVRLDVLAPSGHPRGITARVVLDFKTTGELEESRRVTGSLYLAKQLGKWHVFGYDVAEAVTR